MANQRRAIDVAVSAADTLRILVRKPYYAKKHSELLSIERSDPALSEFADDVRRRVALGMEKLHRISGLSPKQPDVFVFRGKAFSGVPLGEHNSVSNKLYFSDLLARDDSSRAFIDHIVMHELVHYFRFPMESKKLHQRIPNNITDYYLKKSIEEGIADFVGAFLAGRKDSLDAHDVIDQMVAMGRRLEWIKDTYNALQSAEPGAQNGYFTRFAARRRLTIEVGADGISIKLPYVETTNEYNVGAMVAVMLLASNGFDSNSTAIEMLSNSNSAMLQRLRVVADSALPQVEETVSGISSIAKKHAGDLAQQNALANSAARKDLYLFIESIRK
jgi:hypothetical protein